MDFQTHWNAVYATRPAQTVSWYQPHAALSLALIQRTGAGRDANIIDVGGGASTLVDDLLANAYRDITVLDLSAEALALARARLGQAGSPVRWLTGDVTTTPLPARHYDIWHDRAVFHFLTEAAQRRAYVEQVMRALRPGGHVIVATFAPDGPLQCSGLPVMRYSADSLHHAFGSAFQLVEHCDEEHRTPAGTLQHFIYCHCLAPH